MSLPIYHFSMHISPLPIYDISISPFLIPVVHHTFFIFLQSVISVPRAKRHLLRGTLSLSLSFSIPWVHRTFFFNPRA